MADTNTTLGSAGVGELVDAVGQTWQIAPPTQNVKGAFEAWMKLNARKELIAQRPFLSAKDYGSECAVLMPTC